MKKPAIPVPVFDDVAHGYDDRFSNQPIAKHLRGEVHQAAKALLPAKGHILEIGCGTGEDMKHFVAHGHDIMATDPSQNMLEITRQKPPLGQGAGRVETEIWNADRPLPPKVLASGPYDLVFSNFGALNCVADLAHVRAEISKVLKPGGACVFVLINRWCLLEVVLNLLIWSPKNMTRRFRKQPTATLEDGSTFKMYFPSVTAINTAFGADYKVESTAPLGVFLPPSELYTAFQKRPKLLRFASFLDRTLGRLWPFSRLGDHFIVVLRRKPA